MARVQISTTSLPATIGIHRFLCFALVMATVAGCAEPFIVLPGKSLSGEVTPTPADWTEFVDIEVVQLETRPPAPYSINIWLGVIGPDIYVATGDEGTNWTEHLSEDPLARLRIDSRIYELRAVRVRDPEEIERVASVYVSKYNLDSDVNWVEEGQVYRLDRR